MPFTMGPKKEAPKKAAPNKAAPRKAGGKASAKPAPKPAAKPAGIIRKGGLSRRVVQGMIAAAVQKAVKQVQGPGDDNSEPVTPKRKRGDGDGGPQRKKRRSSGVGDEAMIPYKQYLRPRGFGERQRHRPSASQLSAKIFGGKVMPHPEVHAHAVQLDYPLAWQASHLCQFRALMPELGGQEAAQLYEAYTAEVPHLFAELTPGEREELADTRQKTDAVDILERAIGRIEKEDNSDDSEVASTEDDEWAYLRPAGWPRDPTRQWAKPEMKICRTKSFAIVADGKLWNPDAKYHQSPVMKSDQQLAEEANSAAARPVSGV